MRTYTYDRRGFLKSETIPEYGPSGNGTRYNCRYDPLGIAWKVHEVPCNQTASAGIEMTYDYATRMTSVSEEGARPLKQFVFEPGTGRLQTAKSFNYLPEVGYTTFEVDETYAYAGIGGSVSSRTTEFFVNGLPQEEFTTSLTLDRAGQVRNLVYPTCASGLCGSGGPTGRSIDYRYAKGFLSTIPGFINIPITYHTNGLFSQVLRSNGMRIDQSIDTTTMMQRPNSVNVYDATGAALSYSGVFQYDGSGNIKARGTAFNYRYDAVSRLVESRETWGSTTYLQKPTFDAYGNIQSLETGPMGGSQEIQTTTSSTTNRLTTVGTFYDMSGNMTKWANGPIYEYDRLNRMRRFQGSSSPSAEDWVFAYTVDDERILSMRVAGGGTRWSLRGLDNQVLREWRADLSMNSFKDYVWTGRDLVAKIERTPTGGDAPLPYTEETIHAAADHLGTPRIYTGPDGLARPGHIYFPFGQELTTSQDDERMKYTGHERDLWNTTSTADDLDYMHARHYNPQLGRFLRIDPLVGSVRRPQTLNRYSYVAGNPMNLIDPTGMLLESEICSVGTLGWSNGEFGFHWGSDSGICATSGGGGGGGWSETEWRTFTGAEPFGEKKPKIDEPPDDPDECVDVPNGVPDYDINQTTAYLRSRVGEIARMPWYQQPAAMAVLVKEAYDKTLDPNYWNFGQVRGLTVREGIRNRNYGNYHFGVVMKVLGFTWAQTRVIADVAEVLDHDSRESTEPYIDVFYQRRGYENANPCH